MYTTDGTAEARQTQRRITHATPGAWGNPIVHIPAACATSPHAPARTRSDPICDEQSLRHHLCVSAKRMPAVCSLRYAPTRCDRCRTVSRDAPPWGRCPLWGRCPTAFRSAVPLDTPSTLAGPVGQRFAFRSDVPSDASQRCEGAEDREGDRPLPLLMPQGPLKWLVKVIAGILVGFVVGASPMRTVRSSS